MYIKKINSLLEKSRSILKDIEDSESSSALEIDLLKQYMITTYNAVLELERKTASRNPPVKTFSKTEEVETKKENTSKEEKKRPEPVAHSVDNGKPEPLKSVPNGEIEKLFAIEYRGEVSDRLSNSALTDINNGMGINEKHYTINELFGGNRETFNNAISHLNSLSDFSHAREYLTENFITKYNWIDRQKNSVAKNFIKVVHRRYK